MRPGSWIRALSLLGLSAASLPPAAAVLGLVALLTTPLALLGLRSNDADAVKFWTFANRHVDLYTDPIEAWNVSGGDPIVDLRLIGMQALQRRTMDGFLARIPTADLIEAEVRMMGSFFAGPTDAVGFLDLTDRLQAEGLLERINPASFSPWMKDGRVFGLPHDVHPVMLGYRADLVEEAGIDVSEIETWADFARVMRPLMADEDDDGEPDRYLISFWTTGPHRSTLEMLMLQAGGGFFDESGEPVIASDVNARVLATLVGWVAGPDRIAADVPEFNAAGNQLFGSGFIVANFAPDWMCNVWKNDVATLHGKMRLMPLPAWEPGGRRTSVRGGTMLGIARDAPDHDKLWTFAKKLYFDPQLARDLYQVGDIITPLRDLWDDPVFDQPDPYFMGQRKGRDYMALADDLPPRPSTPYNEIALSRVQDEFIALVAEADRRGEYGAEELEPLALELLERAEASVRKQIERNVFLGGQTR
ncbi:MAG: extracellular solute-binding protein [Planctomycetota bacterium]